MSEQWIPHDRAIEIIRQRFNCSVGRAEALLRQACAAEVRRRHDATLLLYDDGLMGMDSRPLARPPCANPSPLPVSEDDLLHWLDREAPAPACEKEQPRHRYPGDAALVEKALAMLASGEVTSDRKAARKLAPLADNTTNPEERLRDLIGKARRARRNG